MKYVVKVSNGASYSPDYPYEGTDKNIAIAVASAYIAQGKKVFVYESEQVEQIHMKFKTADEVLKAWNNMPDDIPGVGQDIYQCNIVKWLWSVENECDDK